MYNSFEKKLKTKINNGVLIMPSRDIHKLISKLLFGEDGNNVHKYMDEPFKWLGKNHRSQRHNLLTAAFLQFTKGGNSGLHAIGHILTDQYLSAAVNEFNKRLKNIFKTSLGK